MIPLLASLFITIVFITFIVPYLERQPTPWSTLGLEAAKYGWAAFFLFIFSLSVLTSFEAGHIWFYRFMMFVLACLVAFPLTLAILNLSEAITRHRKMRRFRP